MEIKVDKIENVTDEIKLRCLLCNEDRELQERESNRLASGVDEFDFDTDKYLREAILIIKGKCSKSEDGEHIWEISDDSAKRLNEFVNSFSSIDQKLSILVNKNKNIDEDMVKLEDTKKKIEEQLIANVEEKKQISDNILKEQDKIAQVGEEFTKFTHIKDIEKFKKIWIYKIH